MFLRFEHMEKGCTFLTQVKLMVAERESVEPRGAFHVQTFI